MNENSSKYRQTYIRLKIVRVMPSICVLVSHLETLGESLSEKRTKCLNAKYPVLIRPVGQKGRAKDEGRERVKVVSECKFSVM